MDLRLDHEPDTIIELTESAHGMWNYPAKQCCIYKVPHRLRKVQPEAYTPQLVLIGPLNRNFKSQACNSCGDITKTTSMGYLNMEKHKKIYLEAFAQRVKDKITIDLFRGMIKEDEAKIRASYSESTSWIESSKFVDMILLDAVFILEHMLRIYDAYGKPEKREDDANYNETSFKKTGDLIVDDPCLQITIKEDLMLLENQLPYFILEKIFDTVIPTLLQDACNEIHTSRELILKYFGFDPVTIKDESRFIHFTDLLRSVRVDGRGVENPSKTTLRYLADLFRDVIPKTCRPREPSKENTETHVLIQSSKAIKHMYNAEKLYSAGVKFEVMQNELSIDVIFENGCLKMPCLWICDDMELTLRNIMALEQCHYPSNTYVCNFVTFLDFLIDSAKDVDLLTEKGIIKNWIGEQKLVAEMVNKLGVGITEDQSRYFDVATKVNAYYDNPINRTRAVLDRMYFSNLWRGTATIAAILLLVMTLIQTIASVIQVMQK